MFIHLDEESKLVWPKTERKYKDIGELNKERRVRFHWELCDGAKGR